ncbi:2-dehydro-3-deoxygalactonokinase [Nocardiopsis tropica]|uniref:2-dehydro-3-deoxygalactonokinase n=1 Tax=Nocardiopsis tropica TaxID=109330 RepID=A0ABU7L1J0_9ACTN|nr:2-dehydro-3-deoxygalactonokinase [Nocardiopsis umidischolae]MEE2055399.1 2-dehydro-3-deoxygalactonokinase [Nocardiopsis umidischolae]
MDDYSAARLVALDWGTSSCRAYLLTEDGTVLDHRSTDDGVMRVTAGAREAGESREQAFDRALRSLCLDWVEAAPGALPVVASGMVGSDQGWAQAPYVELPVDPLATALPLTRVESSLGPVHILPGLTAPGPLPGLLRGEETQIVGALLADGAADAPAQTGGGGERIVVLPGTHAKWVRLRGSVVTGFATHMSGEVYALLMENSILGRLARPAEGDRWEAYERGLDVAMGPDGDPGLLGTLFSARALVVTGRLRPDQVGDYVSGLVIGSEVRGELRGGADAPGADDVLLLGTDDLCDRYGRALSRAGVASARGATGTTPRALAHLARRAGLLDGGSGTAGPDDADRAPASP